MFVDQQHENMMTKEIRMEQEDSLVLSNTS